ncbi:MAG TPA: TetR/AcrR family transcriptional regulator [Solimonas sp.]|nr:TetR/AcrR family transcriptional regulator [Solimonas sp.]
MLQLVGSQGYSATTVLQVVKHARASSNAFYELFKDKEDCFLTMCEEEAANFSDAILNAALKAPDWRAAVAIAIREALVWWQNRPQLARAFLLDIPTIGERATKCRQATYRPFEHLLTHVAGWARESVDSVLPIRKHIPHLLISGITDLIAEEVRAGRGGKLRRLEDDLVYAVVSLVGSEPNG